jgi:CBS domain-containing protein
LAEFEQFVRKSSLAGFCHFGLTREFLRAPEQFLSGRDGECRLKSALVPIGLRIANSSPQLGRLQQETQFFRGEAQMVQKGNYSRNEEQVGAEASMIIGPTEVADVMTGKVVTLSPHHSFSEAANLMNDRYFRHCVVIDSRGCVVGVISDRDILRALARNPNARSKSLEQVMTRNPVTVRRNTPIAEAVGKIISKRINCLPVVESDGTVCGIVTSTDLLKSYQQLLEMMHKAR